jgi:site-specific recombinase XerD
MNEVVRARISGPLALHADGLREQLGRLGYTPGSVENLVRDMAQLSRWLLREGLEPVGLTSAKVNEYCTARGVGGPRRTPTERSLAPLLSYLRDRQVVPPVDVAPPTPLDELLDRYRHHLVTARGLAATTVLRYEVLARRFLQRRPAVAAGGTGVEGLTGADVTDFLLGECARLSVGSSKGRVAELRSLLRFVYLEGLTPTALADAVPPVAGWRDTALPVAVSAAQIQALLHGCDRTQPTGLRNFAILTVLARLGLRSVEVAALRLNDVDWRAGEIVIRGSKGRRDDRLPLPDDVGEALVAYLRSGRPQVACRAMFVTCKAPRRGIHARIVGDVVRHTGARLGLAPVGAHRLRHALATELLREGADLVEISQVLRHRDLATTAIYAKIDREALRSVARPWPGGRR